MATRFAIYVVPDDEALFQRASQWLGWDCVAARLLDPPSGSELANPAGISITEVTATPRKYGFHGTIKPPFSLLDGIDETMLVERALELAAELSPVTLEALEIRSIGGFMALVPTDAGTALGALAARFVTGLDEFRTPAAPSELARRRSAGLTPRQEELLLAWGYPYVLDEFRFHLTLTGRLEEQTIAPVADMLSAWIGPTLPQPFRIDRLALVEQREGEMFRLVRWLPLGIHDPAG